MPSSLNQRGTEAPKKASLRVSVSLWFPLSVAVALTVGCRQDMHDTPRYEALEKSDFFSDRRSARRLWRWR